MKNFPETTWKITVGKLTEKTGIPVGHEENCKVIAKKIGEMMRVEDKYLNIDVAHRLLTNSEEKIPAIIVKFKREDRDKFFEKR